ncbi:putative ABC transporter permease subunit [Clostridium ganghwense]|uniref:ABC-2 type transport system permease protein n=1 Tax=Clostridium ganghwense TaxID=312089 RepID=A0ABT4CM69_9CLOT|nr:hypothetical protein [Clostridium ganghwense]MCY6370144.1 hypothetical protein [Clostridium ganghwense]
MSRFIALTKVLLKTSGDFWGNKKSDKNSKLKSISLKLLLAACFLPLAIMMGEFVSSLYEGLSFINQQGVILSFGFVLVSLVAFFFGIFYVMGTFYFSMDIDNLLPLPFRPSEILGAKFVVVLIYEYITELLVLLPIIIVYGFESGAGALYYIFSTLIFLTLPIIPLVLASVIVMVIMRFTGIAKNKDRFRIVGGILILFLSLGINIFIQRTSQSTLNPETLQQMFVEGNNSLVNIVSGMFPSSKIASLAVLESSNITGITNMAIFIAMSILAIGIFIVVGEGLYLKGVVGISETKSKRKKLSEAEIDKIVVQNSVFKTYLIKELKILFRTPAYFMNCVLMNFLWPVFLLIPMLASPQGIGNFKELGMVINNPRIAALVVVVGFALIVFITSNSPIACTSISREGKNFYINKYLPISYKKQIVAKVLSAFILGIISMVMLLVALLILFEPPKIIVVLIGLVSLLGILFSNFVGILIDLYRPKLDWDNEQKAVKQNMNILLNSLPCVLIAAITVFIVFKFKLSLVTATILIIGVFGTIDFMLFRVLMTKGVQIYNNINN